jgi:hypothetical protein
MEFVGKIDVSPIFWSRPMFQGLAGFFTPSLGKFGVDERPLASNTTAPISLTKSALDSTLREFLVDTSFLEKAIVREHPAFNAVVPNDFLHLIHIFLRQNPLSATRLINKWVVVKGLRIVSEDCFAPSSAYASSPEDIRFKKGGAVATLLGKGKIVHALYSGLLWSLVMRSHC